MRASMAAPRSSELASGGARGGSARLLIDRWYLRAGPRPTQSGREGAGTENGRVRARCTLSGSLDSQETGVLPAAGGDQEIDAATAHRHVTNSETVSLF